MYKFLKENNSIVLFCLYVILQKRRVEHKLSQDIKLTIRYGTGANYVE